MESDIALEHLSVIRTLMERSSLYRRALAPVMVLCGICGLVTSILGIVLHMNQIRSFIAFWSLASIVPIVGSMFLIRRQAMAESEPFWSPPARRVLQGLAPSFVTGAAVGAMAWHWAGLFSPDAGIWQYSIAIYLALIWVLLYGIGLHAAAFFILRGIRWLAWILVLLAVLFLLVPASLQPLWPVGAHGVMGFFFGFLHLLYGIYLYVTGERKTIS